MRIFWAKDVLGVKIEFTLDLQGTKNQYVLWFEFVYKNWVLEQCANDVVENEREK